MSSATPPSSAAAPAPDATGAPDRSKLDRAMVGGLAWSAASRWLSQLFRWAATIATARLLLPSDYGIVGMATVLIGFLHNIAEFGFGSAIVQQRHLSRERVQEIGGAALLISGGLFLLACALTPLVVMFYDEPALRLVVPVMGTKFLIDAFATTARSTLQRDLRFKELSIIEGIESLVMAGVTVGLAWLTRSYWCFVVSNLVAGVVFVVLAQRASPHPPKLPRSLGEIVPQLRFGRDVVLARLAWYTYSNADFAIVGRMLSKAALGAYSLAWNVASLPAEKFSTLVLRVAPSILAAAREQPGEMRRYYLMLVRGVALVAMPIAIGLALVVEPLVMGLVGAKWADAIAPMRILCLFFAIRSIAALGPVVMVSRGEPHVDRNFSFVFALILPLLFAVGTRWGLLGVAAVWLTAYPVIFGMLQQRWVLRTLEIPVATFLGESWPAVSSAAIMAVPVFLIDHYLPEAAPALVRLVLMALAGAATYVGVLRTLHREAFDGAVSLIRNRGITKKS